MSLENITNQIREKLKMAPQIGAVVKLDFGDDGIVLIDGTKNPPEITHEDGDASTTLICSIETFKGLANGTQDSNIAFMMGKIKIKGSMGLAMKLNSILED